MNPRLPPRYEQLAVLGCGGGGLVWATRDRITNKTVALKALAEGATEREMGALVREATALSGLEGLGFPRVLRFGRLPDNQRAYMVRELAEGQSLAALAADPAADAMVCLDAVARAADQLTGLHRAGLLHGDVKPANVIVSSSGQTTLVDLGLAAPWREGGTRPEGLTPQYAPPELFAGMPLTVRGEIYALGATLAEVLGRFTPYLEPPLVDELGKITERATHADPSVRHPSADELASALRLAAHIPIPAVDLAADAAWAVVGVDAAANLLLTQIATLPRGSVLAIEGKRGSGRTVLLRRAAWTLGIQGRDVAWVEQEGSFPATEALDIELGACHGDEGTTVLVDEAERLPQPPLERLTMARCAGARVVLVASASAAAALGGPVVRFPVPALDDRLAAGLVRRAIPSLSDALVRNVVARAEGRPGRLRGIVRTIGSRPVVSLAEIDQLLETEGRPLETASTGLPKAEACLDQGRFEEAAAALSNAEGEPVAVGLARARLVLGQGHAQEAIELLEQLAPLAAARGGQIARRWALQAARAWLRLGKYAESAQTAKEAVSSDDAQSDPISLEALATLGLVHSYCGEHERAERLLRDTAERASTCSDKRVLSVVLGSLAVALQRADKLGEARRAHEETLDAAEAAGDAGAVANTRLNLAVLTQGEGDLAGAIRHLEAAIDMGRRAGRGSTTRQALLNLANLDLYLGRYARARSSIAALVDQRDQLSPNHNAQLIGLEALLASGTGEIAQAAELYRSCVGAYDALGRQIDAAEARLELVLVAARAPSPDPISLSRLIEQAIGALGDSTAHRALLGLASGVVFALQNEEDRAKAAYDDALHAARQAGQREWIWRTLQARSGLLYEMGQALAARKDGEEALAVLEEIAARLPRDLREVFWDDARRRLVRSSHLGTMASAKARSVSLDLGATSRAGRGTLTTLHCLPADEKLARLLEINRELACEHDLERLLERVTDHAIALLSAERGFVILSEQGELTIHTSRNRKGGEDQSARFSRGIAERVIASGEPIVTLNASDDERMVNYLSLHQFNVQSVACVPIRAPDGRAVGALYLETSGRPGLLFHEELPTLRAFADQAAVAIENARLVNENAQRAHELETANSELIRARNRLEELLGHRTAQLEITRRDLATTRAVLRGHFGYHGLVGTSEKMRRVYALIDRVKDMDVPVLINGESGTGKEVVARAIHGAGCRAKKPFTGINCGAIPEHLLESELFGHVRGAFTGADRDRKGLFRESDDGTILLDEIGEMPSKMQASLLRVLQEHLVRPVGGVREETVSARVIAATHRNLESMVTEGSFRDDLYYRLHVVEVCIPPLREHADDIPVLIDHFLQIFAARYRRDRKTISREALRFLCACPWPGNVRQLENTLLNAWVMCDRLELGIEDFEVAGLRKAVQVPDSGFPTSSVRPIESPTYGAHQASEKDRILSALSACNWNRVRAAEMVGMPRRTFYRRLRKHGIQ